MPYKKVEIINQWSIDDFYVAGVSFTISDSPVCEQAWDEIVLFGFTVSERGGDSPETSTFDDTKSVLSDISGFSALNVAAVQDKHVSAQFMLIKPVSMTNFSVSSEDLIEMKNVDIRVLKRFFLCSLPSDAMYFLLGLRELIEVTKMAYVVYIHHDPHYSGTSMFD